MDMLKLNRKLKRFIILFIFSTLVSCSDKKINEENEKFCNNDSIIHLRNNKISFWFVNDSINIFSQNISVKQIRNGKIISELKYRKNWKNNYLEIKDPVSLKVNDSLQIICENNKKIILYDFRNIPDYGGKKILGCSFGSYKIKGKEIGLIDSELLSIY